MTDPNRYFVVDIETDGPFPGTHSMLNLSAIVTDENAVELDTFSVNLLPLDGAEGDAETLKWWKSQGDVWLKITKDAQAPETAINAFADFVRPYPGKRIFVGHPLIFDGQWVSYYMEKFLGQGLMAFHGVPDPLFFGAGIDLPSYVAGALDLDYAHCRHGRYPAEIATDIAHTHFGLDDARGHADVFRKTILQRRKT